MTLPAYRFAAIESGADWPGMAADLAQILADGVRCHDHEAAAQAAVGLGFLEFLGGRFNSATRWLSEAELHFEREDAFGLVGDVHLLRIGIATRTGDTDGTARSLERLRLIDGSGRPRPLSRRAYLARGEGWATCVRNPQQGAAELLAAAETFLADMPGFTALLSLRRPARRRLTRAGERAAGRRRAALRGAARRRLRRARERAREPRRARAAGRRRRVRGDRRAPIRHARRGPRRDALRGRRAPGLGAPRRRARHRPARAGSRTEPPVIDGIDSVAVSLTARESQLVGLARQGLGNAEIADRLVLSVRTVETHLYRAMQKLGVGDRRDL